MSDKCEHGEWEDSCPCCLRYEISILAKQLEQANKELATAHRKGWEQAKEQIIAEWEKPYGLTDGSQFIARLRGLEYKEKANDQTR